MLKFHNIEVPYLDIEKKQLGIVIHHSHTEDELRNPEIIEKISNNVAFIRNYLIDEGFIESNDIQNWKYSTKGIYHQPK